jgi:membrane protease YdiL (CAAX protease family)
LANKGDFFMDTQNNKHTTRNLVIFSLLVLTIPWLGRGLDSLADTPSSEEGPGLLLWIIAPIGVSLLLRALAGGGWKDIGLRPAIEGNALWYAISILVYPVCVTLILVIGLVTGAISVPDSVSDPLGVFLQGFIAALIPQFLINILEEFGFRGYLAPKLYALGWDGLLAHGIVGLVWGAWHLPYLSYVTSYTTESALTLAPRFLVGAVAASLIYGEIRLLTGSVWPAVLMQTVGGAFLSGLLLEDLIEISSGSEFLLAPVLEGGLTIVFFALVGVGIYRWRKKEGRLAK